MLFVLKTKLKSSHKFGPDVKDIVVIVELNVRSVSAYTSRKSFNKVTRRFSAMSI